MTPRSTRRSTDRLPRGLVRVAAGLSALLGLAGPGARGVVAQEIPPPRIAANAPLTLLAPPAVADPPPQIPQPPAPGVDPSVPAALPEPAQGPSAEGPLIDPIGSQEGEIELIVGTSRLFQARRSFGRVVVANPLVAEIQLLDGDKPVPKLLNLYGLAYGSTTLTLFDDEDRAQTFAVRVRIDTDDLEKRIGEFFPGATVKVRQVGTQIVLEGQVPDAKTMAEVLQLVSSELVANRNPAAPGAVVTPGPGRSNAGPQGGNVQGAAGPGGAMPPGGSLGAGGGGGGFNNQLTGPQSNIINRLRVPGPRQVILRVKIAELNRTAIRELGVNFLRTGSEGFIGSTIGNVAAIGAQAGSSFPPLVSNVAGTAVNTSAGQLFGIFNAGQFALFINALRQNSLAKIIAEPSLVALDGQPARFLAGGQFPYPVPQGSSTPGGGQVITIQFADFGAILQFIPHIQANDVIRLDVEPVFSELNFGAGTSIAGTTVPAINQRSARTVVELREGQTLALAGLLQNRTNAVTARVPLLGDIPIVGPWFSRNTIQTLETELVVFVTPELVAPIEACEVAPTSADRVQEPNDYEFFFLGRIEGKTGIPHRATTHVHDPFEVMKHLQSEDRWVIGPHGHAD